MFLDKLSLNFFFGNSRILLLPESELFIKFLLFYVIVGKIIDEFVDLFDIPGAVIEWVKRNLLVFQIDLILIMTGIVSVIGGLVVIQVTLGSNYEIFDVFFLFDSVEEIFRELSGWFMTFFSKFLF